ncbi:DUF6011 domain-containing protein [Actinokineospora enzanensis]|uniref:DUF6011 domain-containing protein n=1 Tax=Actinokineospora enzanensis TaxID=155975 RepID=UPI00036B8561|nr:DUF6011 domain-containing protein [Actinokineospora enzanensis]
MNTTTTTTTHCGRCGRTLRSATSIARGYGRTCAAKIAKATNEVAETAEYKPVQIEKAAELLELRAITRTAPKIYLAVSSRGDATYSIDQHAGRCDCPAGDRGLRCYHLAAAAILAA